MKRAKHTGETSIGCPACITKAEVAKMPWHGSYLDVIDRFQAEHDKATNKAKGE